MNGLVQGLNGSLDLAHERGGSFGLKGGQSQVVVWAGGGGVASGSLQLPPVIVASSDLPLSIQGFKQGEGFQQPFFRLFGLALDHVGDGPGSMGDPLVELVVQLVGALLGQRGVLEQVVMIPFPRGDINQDGV